jgi:hypothetical protein
MQATKSHRNRKNGASREQWQARKAAANAARPKQSEIESTNGDRLIVRYVRTK